MIHRVLGLWGSLLAATTTAAAQGFTLWQLGTPWSSNPTDQFGSEVETIGDLDGDGLPDLLVAAVEYGGARGLVSVHSTLDGASLLQIAGSAASDRLGHSVAVPGDVNGDGLPDVFAGAPQTPNNCLYTGNGFARLYSGANGALLLNLTGQSGGDKFGWAVAGAGDVDLDGTVDLVVGAPQVFCGGPGLSSLGGYVKVYSGVSGSTLLSLQNSTFGEGFGVAVAGGQDLTGDDVPDVLVGVPMLNPPTGPAPGEVRIFSGTSGTLHATLAGTSPADRFGLAVALPGDLDGDGVADPVAGAPRMTSPFYSPSLPPGSATAFSGSSGALLFTMNGTLAGDGFGYSIAATGDLDGDAVPDLVVGSPTYRVPGSPSFPIARGRVDIRSGADGSPLFESWTIGGDLMGASVANLGDLDGDGFDDVVVGAPAAAYVRVYSRVGTPLGSVPFGVGCPGSGGFLPRLRFVGGPPATIPGNPAFGALLDRVLGNSLAILVLGFSFQQWGGTPLPLDLGLLGIPGCSLYVSADVFLPAVTGGTGPGNGKAFFDLPVPVDPTLAGWLLHFQAYVSDPGPGLVPGAISGAVQVILL